MNATAGGLRLAQAACLAGLTYAAISVYWAVGGTWLLDTVGGTLEQQGRAGSPGIILAVWAAAVLKIIGAIVPLAATGVAPGQATIAWRRQMRVLAWLEAAILTVYGLVLTGAGLLVQSGAIASAVSTDHRALAWHAYLWDPWFLLWGVLVTAALIRSRQPRAADQAHERGGSNWAARSAEDGYCSARVYPAAGVHVPRRRSRRWGRAGRMQWHARGQRVRRRQ